MMKNTYSQSNLYSLTRLSIFMLCLAPGVYFTLNPWIVQLITPDSWGYQQFSSTRDMLYPYILQFIRALFHDDTYVIYPQLWARCAATCMLGFAVLNRFNNPFYAIAVTIAVLANPFNYQIDAMVMTDSFFCTGITLFFACLLNIETAALQQKKLTKHLIYLSIVIGITTAIRPIAITLIPLLPFILLIYNAAMRHYTKLYLCALIIPLVLILGASKMAHIQRHGTDPFLLKHSLLLGKAGIMDVPPLETSHYPEIAKDLHAYMRPKHEDLRNETSITRYLNKTRDYEVAAQFHYSNALILETAKERNIPFHHIMADIGMDYIKAYPHLYLKDTLIHTIGSWVIFDEGELTLPQHIVRYTIYNVGLSSLLIMCWGFFTLLRRPLQPFPVLWQIPFLAATYLHGYTLFIGLFGVFVSRYTSCVWPVMCLAIGLPVLYATTAMLQKIKTRPPNE